MIKYLLLLQAPFIYAIYLYSLMSSNAYQYTVYYSVCCSVDCVVDL